MRSFADPEVEAVFQSYPRVVRDQLLIARGLVFETAQGINEIELLEETLKWGNPSYLASRANRQTKAEIKVGTTLRLAWLSKTEHNIALSVHCQTSLIGEFKQAYPQLRVDGNRSLILDSREPLPAEIVCHFISLALTYHSRK